MQRPRPSRGRRSLGRRGRWPAAPSCAMGHVQAIIGTAVAFIFVPARASMSLRTFLAAVRRHWVTFVVVAAIPTVAAVGWALTAPPTFVSTTRLFVTITGSPDAPLYRNDELVRHRINTYIPLLMSDAAGRRVVEALGLQLTPHELSDKVSATSVPPRTTLIDVAITDNSAERAKLIAATLAREFVEYVDEFETPTGTDPRRMQVRVVEPASEPHERAAERVILVGLASLAGIVLGAAAVWVRASRDPSAPAADEVTSAS